MLEFIEKKMKLMIIMHSKIRDYYPHDHIALLLAAVAVENMAQSNN